MPDSRSSQPVFASQMLFVGLICLIGMGVLIMMAGRNTPNSSIIPLEVIEEPGDPVIARLGNEVITQKDIDLARAYFGPELSDPEIIERLVQQKLFTKLASELDVHSAPDTQRRLKFSNEAILSEAAVDIFLKDAVTEGEIQEFYANETQQLSGQMQIKARQIVLPDTDTALEIIRRLDDGESFASLALAFSLDRASREAGGDLGYIHDDTLDEVLSDRIFAAKDGQRLDLIETPQGWHVVEVLSRRPVPVTSLAERRGAIVKLISSQKLATKLDELRENTPLTLMEASE